MVAPLSLRRFTAEQRADRLAAFNSTVLSCLLLMLYLVYPGVSVAIFGIFSCTTFASGRSFLDADANLKCYDSLHMRYVGVAIFWLFGVTVGIPLFFLWLLRHFKVPHLAELLTDNAWMREAVQLAWQEKMPQPDIDFRKLTIDSISDAHLEALYAFFCHDASTEEAAEILAGARPAVVVASPRKGKQEEPQPHSAALRRLGAAREGMLSVLQSAHSKVAGAARKCTGSNREHAPDPTQDRRRYVLHELLVWCKTSGDLALPHLQWQEVKEEEEQLDAAAAERKRASRAPAAGHTHSEDIGAVQTRAVTEVGFLFTAYRVDCWCVLGCRQLPAAAVADACSRCCVPRCQVLGDCRAWPQARAHVNSGAHRARLRRPSGCRPAACACAYAHASALTMPPQPDAIACASRRSRCSY